MKAKGGEVPLVSICIPNHNYGRFLRACILSALRQDYPNLEVVVFDNASTDNSVKVANGIKDSRMRLVKSGKLLSQPESFNTVFSKARGKYIFPLCSDDTLCENGISELVAFAEEHRLGVAFANVIVVREDGTVASRSSLLKRLFKTPSQYVKESGNGVPNLPYSFNAILFRRDCLKAARFEDRYRTAADTAFIFDIVRRFRAGYIDKYVVRYLDHGSSTNSTVRSEEILEDWYKYLRHRRSESSPEIWRRDVGWILRSMLLRMVIDFSQGRLRLVAHKWRKIMSNEALFRLGAGAKAGLVLFLPALPLLSIPYLLFRAARKLVPGN